MKRAGVDVGGTFTDAVIWDEETGAVESAKGSSTHPHADRGVVAALDKLSDAVADQPLRHLVHGTTVATNACLERSGPRIAMLCTRGFRDVLEIGRIARHAHELYDLRMEPPAPLVRRRDRLEVDERVTHDGAVVAELDEASVREAARAIAARGIDSTAACLLHAHANSDHEQRVRRIFADVAPEVRVSLSSEILPEFREYERGSTTVLNAYLVPVVSGYLDDLRGALDAWRPDLPLWVMQSNGGLTSAERAAREPVTLLLSGPSGGVVAGRVAAGQAGLENSITVDMGGTSFDACLLPGNQPSIARGRSFADVPVATPAIDILTIGTGGGSIGWVDAGGQFRVGPRSAGANPGPVCYGRGGTEATVTDANLVLGILGAGQLLGGEVALDRDAAVRACERLGAKMGLSAHEAAAGIRRIVNAAMAGAVRAVSVGRGHDPRTFGLVAFGGAGPMHAADIASELGIPTVVIPPVPGCHSAVGLVMTDVSHDYVATILAAAAGPAADAEVGAALDRLERSAQEDLADEGVEPERRVLSVSVDVRYRGQQSALTVPLARPHAADRIPAVVETFHAHHEQLYGFRADGDPIELVNVRVHAVGRMESAGAVELPAPRANVHAAPTAVRSSALGREGSEIETPVYHRDHLEPGSVVHGPAIVEQGDSTIAVSAGWSARTDRFGNLIMEVTR
jgi:N-methylhydantoinase A